MTSLSASTTTGLSQRFAGWAAIGSGVISFVAFVFLMLAVVERGRRTGGNPGPLLTSLRTTHDVGVMLQALLMIPVASVFHAFGRKRSPSLSGATFAVGVVALSLVAFLQLLLVVNVVPDRLDILYMAPLGVVGVWLIVVNWLVSSVLPRGLTRTGMVAGLGLAVLGISALLFLTFQAFGGSAAVADPRIVRWNRELHIGLAVGSLVGRTVFPIWAVLLGRKLLQVRAKSNNGMQRTALRAAADAER